MYYAEAQRASHAAEDGPKYARTSVCCASYGVELMFSDDVA